MLAMRARWLRGAGSADHGAAAVEFALLLPLLLLLLFGIIDFGRALNAQITLTQAAREGARLAALGNTTAGVDSGTIAAGTGLNLSDSNVSVTSACPSNFAPGSNAIVTVTYSFAFVTPVGAIAGLFGSGFGSPITLTATGVMPCEV
jgi:Flp pilus assembly protein TadG